MTTYREKRFPVRAIRFSREMYNEINVFADKHGISFGIAVKLLLANALKNEKEKAEQ